MVRFVGILLGVLIFSSSIFANQGVQELIDHGEYTQAVTEARQIMDSGSLREQSNVAPLLLKALSALGDHAPVENDFPRCLEVTDSFEANKALCYFERAKSVEKNLKDKVQAVFLYNEIVNQFPEQELPASGALLHRGSIELSQKKSEVSKATYNDLLFRYPSSPYYDDAYAGLAKCEAALLNPQGIEEVVRQMEEKFPSRF